MLVTVAKVMVLLLLRRKDNGESILILLVLGITLTEIVKLLVIQRKEGIVLLERRKMIR